MSGIPNVDITGCLEDVLATARETRKLLEKIEYVIEYGKIGRAHV